MRTCINNAWAKLDQYYNLLGDSPLYAAALILHPNFGLKALKNLWTAPEQLLWIKQAEDDLKAYFEEWYQQPDDTTSNDTTPASHPSTRPPPPSGFAPNGEDCGFDQWVYAFRQQASDSNSSELERYYRLDPEPTKDPIRWWVDRKSTFPQLSRLALDILAIPAMATGCERAFSAGKLTITSQRHSLQESTVEMLQLMKNWVRNGSIDVGGVRVNDGKDGSRRLG